jgi:hypothetical protein
MEKKFTIKEFNDIPQNGETAWGDYTYDYKEAEEVRPRTSEATGVEGYNTNDTIHYTTMNRPIIQVLDNTLVNDLQISSLLTNFRAVLGTDSFELVSASGNEIILKRGSFVLDMADQLSSFVDFKHEIYKGKKITKADNMSLVYAAGPGDYVIQFDKDGNVFFPNVGGESPSRITIAIISNSGGNWVASSWVDKRSFFGRVDETSTDTEKNKLISNYLLNKIQDNENRIVVLETTEKPTLRDDINQLARDVYTNGVADLGVTNKFDVPLETKIIDLQDQIDVQNTTINEIGSTILNYKSDFNNIETRIKQNELNDLKQQLEIDFLKNNPYIVPDIKTEGFFDKSNVDESIETSANELAEVIESPNSVLGQKVYRYRDFDKKSGLKDSMIKQARRYYFGQLCDEWNFDISNNIGDLEYDEDTDSFFASTNSTSSDNLLIYNFKINKNTDTIQIINWWKLSVPSILPDTPSSIQGICIVKKDDIKYLVVLFKNSNINPSYYFSKIMFDSFIGSSSRKIVATEIPLGSLSSAINSGITYYNDDLYFLRIANNSVNIFKTSFSNQGPAIPVVNISNHIINIKYNASGVNFNIKIEGNNVYITDFDDSIYNTVTQYRSNFYVFDRELLLDSNLPYSHSSSLKNLIQLRERRNGGFCIRKGDLFNISYSLNSSSVIYKSSLQKYKMKNTFLEKGQILSSIRLKKESMPLATQGYSLISVKAYGGKIYALFYNGSGTPADLRNYMVRFDTEGNYEAEWNIKSINTTYIKMTDFCVDTSNNKFYFTVITHETLNAYPGVGMHLILKGDFGNSSALISVYKNQPSGGGIYYPSGITIFNGKLYFFITGLSSYFATTYRRGVYSTNIPTNDLGTVYSPLDLKFCHEYPYDGDFYSLVLLKGLHYDADSNSIFALNLSHISRYAQTDNHFNSCQTIYQIDMGKSYSSSDTEPLIKNKFNVFTRSEVSKTTYTGGSSDTYIESSNTFIKSILSLNDKFYCACDNFMLFEIKSEGEKEATTISYNSIKAKTTYPYGKTDGLMLNVAPVGHNGNADGILFGERFFSPENYSNKTNVLPEKFIVTSSLNGYPRSVSTYGYDNATVTELNYNQTTLPVNGSAVDIFDVSDPMNPIKFMTFLSSSSKITALSRDFNITSTRFSTTSVFMPVEFKFHKDVLYILGKTQGTNTRSVEAVYNLIIIDFKNDEVYRIAKLISGGAETWAIYKFNRSIEERNNISSTYGTEAWALVSSPSYGLLMHDVTSFDIKEINGDIFIVFAGKHDWNNSNHYISIVNFTKKTSFCVWDNSWFGLAFTTPVAYQTTNITLKISDDNFVYATNGRTWMTDNSKNYFKFGPINEIAQEKYVSGFNSTNLIGLKKIKANEKYLYSNNGLVASPNYDSNGFFNGNNVYLNSNFYGNANLPGGESFYVVNESSLGFKNLSTRNQNEYELLFVSNASSNNVFKTSTDIKRQDNFFFHNKVSFYTNTNEPILKDGLIIEEYKNKGSILPFGTIGNFTFPYGYVGSGFAWGRTFPTLAWVNLGIWNLSSISANKNTCFAINKSSSCTNNSSSPANWNPEMRIDNFILNYRTYQRQSIHESSLIEMTGKEKRMIFTTSEHINEGKRLFIETDSSTWTISQFSTEPGTYKDENSIIYSSNNQTHFIKKTFSLGTEKIGLILRNSPSYATLVCEIRENGTLIDTINIKEADTEEFRKIYWVAENLDITKSYEVTIKPQLTQVARVYFDSFVYVKKITRDLENDSKCIKVEFNYRYDEDPEDFFEVDLEGETQFLKEEIFPEFGNRFEITSPSNGVKNVFIPSSSTIPAIYGVDWEYENGDLNVIKTIEISGGQVQDINVDSLRAEYFAVPTKGKLRVTLSQPADADGWYDKYAEIYISDYGIYFGS